MNKFVKISELNSEDRTKIKGYWSELWGKEFANALVTDFKPDGDKKKVNASNKTNKKIAAFEDTLGENPDSNSAIATYNAVKSDFKKNVRELIVSAIESLGGVYSNIPDVADFSRGGESDKAALADMLANDLPDIVRSIVNEYTQQLLPMSETKISI